MGQYKSILWIMLGICLMLLLSICCESAKTSSPPNVVFILADDLGWFDVGFHGSEIKTPNIDRLAKEGVVLNNYYVQPICTPTRAALLTGKYPIHTGMQHYVIVGCQPYGLPLKEKTMAQHLKSMGYSTHAVGKWHLGFFKEDYLPRSRGFDSHLGYYLGKEDYFDHYSSDGSYFGYDFHQDGKPLWNQSETYSTEIFTKHAESVINSHNKSNPLFLYLAHQAAHSGNRLDPIQVPQKYIDRFPYIKNFQRRKFAGVVSALDDSVGQVYKALKNSGMADNTIIVFSTDNGGPTNGYDRNAACNWPLRGCKETLWQGGVRGVGFVHSPLLKKTGYVNNNMMHVVDWLPTIVSAVSATTETTSSAADSNTAEKSQESSMSATDLQNLDGLDQWDSISKNASESPRKEVLLNIDPIQKLEGIIVGEFKLMKGEVARGRFDGWYPPLNSSDNESTRFHEDEISETDEAFVRDDILKRYLKTSSDYFSERPNSSLNKRIPSMELDLLIAQMNSEYKSFIKYSNFDQKYASSDLHFNSDKNLDFNFSNPNNKNPKSISAGETFGTKMAAHLDNNINVKCGPKPVNASTNCNPTHKHCLFHLTSDPCEYNNLAKFLPNIVRQMKERLEYYRATMIPPGNKPEDPNGNPQLHGGVWQPWL